MASIPPFDAALYPFCRSKVLYLVRHAQGFHNEAMDSNPKAYESCDYFDASLTSLGWKQVGALRQHVLDNSMLHYMELVVTSPLTRTMQTASGCFGGGDVIEGDAKAPLMLPNVGGVNHAAISSSSCPPFVATDLCREFLNRHPCDKRRSITESKASFPAINFSAVMSDEDMMWNADVSETDEECNARAKAFLQWLLDRPETRIVVVSHTGFLGHLLGLFGSDCSPLVAAEMHLPFNNCEMRTVVVADRKADGPPKNMCIDFPGGASNCGKCRREPPEDKKVQCVTHEPNL